MSNAGQTIDRERNTICTRLGELLNDLLANPPEDPGANHQGLRSERPVPRDPRATAIRDLLFQAGVPRKSVIAVTAWPDNVSINVLGTDQACFIAGLLLDSGRRNVHIHRPRRTAKPHGAARRNVVAKYERVAG